MEDADAYKERVIRELEQRRRKDEARLEITRLEEERRGELEAGKVRRIAGAMQYTLNLLKDAINDYTGDNDEDEDEDASVVCLVCIKSADASADIIDCSTFEPLEKYLRAYFNIHSSNKKLVLKLKYSSGDVDDSQPLLHGRVTDESLMLNWWAQLEAAAGRDLAAAASGSMHAGLFALKKPTSVIRPRRAQTEKTVGEHRVFKELVTPIYGEEPGHFADGTWDEKASDICRSKPNILKKFLQLQQLTEVVMGSADY